ncbi:poly adp-ribose polymerase family [Anaeramoeba flamelloides]|uniref:Poly adp-ribose polymerase family n=1 Tax=Anaeramoeba flamelloides TaxID=1746091 RepID=A0ABQ8ZA07_9EUKA|nr:poly adp-ribose polymerase family [Anaeramoeba flamelloides]
MSSENINKNETMKEMGFNFEQESPSSSESTGSSSEETSSEESFSSTSPEEDQFDMGEIFDEKPKEKNTGNQKTNFFLSRGTYDQNLKNRGQIGFENRKNRMNFVNEQKTKKQEYEKQILDEKKKEEKRKENDEKFQNFLKDQNLNVDPKKGFFCDFCKKEHFEFKHFQLSCSHNFCIDETVSYLLNHKECKESLQCPACREFNIITPIEPRDLAQLGFTEEESNELYFTMLINQNPDRYFYCPNPDCLKIMEVGRQKKVECPYCKKTFCKNCSVLWHEGVTCGQYYDKGVTEGHGLASLITKCPEMIDFLISTAYIAAADERADLVLNPFPHFFINRKKDINLFYTTLCKIPEILPLIEFARTEKTIKDHLDKIDPLIYKLLRWLIVTNTVKIALIDPKNEFKIFGTSQQWRLITTNTIRERKFASLKKKHVKSLFGFHGSSSENWYSIMRIGLKNYSYTKWMVNGAWSGSGVYVARYPSTSMGYIRSKPTWYNSMSQDPNLSILSMVEVIDDYSFELDDVLVVQNENLIKIRFLFLNVSNYYANLQELNEHLEYLLGKDENRLGFMYPKRKESLILRNPFPTKLGNQNLNQNLTKRQKKLVAMQNRGKKKKKKKKKKTKKRK